MLVLLSAVPALAGTARLAELARGAEITPANARFFAMPLPVVLHILVAIPFSVGGAFQFVPRLRGRSSWHRTAGRILAPLGLAVALSGLWMTLRYPWPEGDGEAVYLLRLVFGTAMLGSIGAGLDAVRRRDFTAHGDWMLRGYAIGMGAGTQVLTHLPWLILAGKPGETGRAVAMGAGWVVNLLAAEWIIGCRHARSGVVSARTA